MPKFDFGSLIEKKSQEQNISPEVETLIEPPKIGLREYAIDTKKGTLDIEKYIKSPSNITFMKISEDLFGKSIRKSIPEMIDIFLDRLNAMKQTLKKEKNTYYYKIQK